MARSREADTEGVAAGGPDCMAVWAQGPKAQQTVPDPMHDPEGQGGGEGCHFWAVLQLMRHLRPHYDRALARSALGAKQYNLLSRIQQTEPVTHRALAASLALDPSTLGRNLQPLLSRQLVAVRPGVDPRSKEISLTLAGRAKLADATRDWGTANAQVKALLGDELTAVLHQVVSASVPRLGSAQGAVGAGPIWKRT